MSDALSWQDHLRALGHCLGMASYLFDEPVAHNDPEMQDKPRVIRKQHLALLEQARHALDAMLRAGLVPPLPGEEQQDDPRHRAYELIGDLIASLAFGTARGDHEQPEDLEVYDGAFREAIAAAESTLTRPNEDSGPPQTLPTAKGTPPESTAPIVHIEGVGQVIVDEKSQTITVNDHVIRFGGTETWRAFLQLWKNKPNPIDLRELAHREPRDVAKDVRKVLRNNGAENLSKRLKAQRSVGYYFDANDAEFSG